MDVREFKTPEEILSEEINYKMFLNAHERDIVLYAMKRYKEQRKPRPLIDKFKQIFKINKL